MTFCSCLNKTEEQQQLRNMHQGIATLLQMAILELTLHRALRQFSLNTIDETRTENAIATDCSHSETAFTCYDFTCTGLACLVAY